MNRKLGFAAAAAFALAELSPAASLGLSLAKNSFQVSPRSVQLSQTLTVSVVVEDDTGRGGVMDVLLEPRPGRLVRLVSAAPPSFSCTVSGSSAGRWTYEAVGPGEVTFELEAVLVSCTLTQVTRVSAISPAVTLVPPAIWSDLKIAPDILAPGEEIEVVLSLRNDGKIPMEYPLPQAQVQLLGEARPLAEPQGDLEVEPESAVSGPGMRLSPGQTVRAVWKFSALKPGEARFFISGAGLLMMSPPVMIRFAPALELVFPSPREEWTVGQTLPLRGEVRARGEAGVRDPEVSLTASPAGAARLLASPAPFRGLLSPGEEGRPLEYSLELLRPGRLHLTLTAAGREADTGRGTRTALAEVVLEVTPPPELKIELVLDSATALAGSKVPFSITVVNGGVSSAASLTPAISFSGGRAQLEPLSPLFQAIPRGATGTFQGALVPEGEGVLEIVAQISARGERGGQRAASSSSPARLLVLPAPAIEFFTGQERVFAGPGRANFRLRNAGSREVILDSASIRMAGGEFGLAEDLLAGRELKLSPGESASLSVSADLPQAADPYWITAGLTLAGRLTEHGAAFSIIYSPRQAMLVSPPARRFVLIQPPSPFRPPLDPLLRVEWSMTIAGVAGLALVGPAGETVRVLAQPHELKAGMHAAEWYGLDGQGKPLAPGRYRLRLAGPAPDMAAWPNGASWTSDSLLDVASP